jgi:MoaA/NifB/PqqE/SkfB family radical SAM enzyme
VNRFFPETSLFRRYAVKEDGQMMKNGCAWLYKRAFIMWNGDVTTCCYDPRGINIMGNVFEAGSFANVWNGRRFQKLRKTVNNDITKAKPLCSICPDRVCVTQPETNES